MLRHEYHGNEEAILDGDFLLSSPQNRGVVIARTLQDDVDRFDVRSFDTQTSSDITALFNTLSDIPTAHEDDVMRGLHMSAYRDRRIERASKRLKLQTHLAEFALGARELIPVMRDSSGEKLTYADLHVYSYRGAVNQSYEQLLSMSRQAFVNFAHSKATDTELDELAARRFSKDHRVARRSKANHGVRKLIEQYLDYLAQLNPMIVDDLRAAMFQDEFERFPTRYGTDGGEDHEVFLADTELARSFNPKTTSVAYRGERDSSEKTTVTLYTQQPPHYAVPHLSWVRREDGSRQLILDARPSYSVLERTVHHPSTVLALSRLAIATEQTDRLPVIVRQLAQNTLTSRETPPKVASGLTSAALLADATLDNKYIERFEAAVA